MDASELAQLVNSLQGAGTSPAIIDLGRRFAEEDGFDAPESIGEIPQGWLTASHVTGQSDVPINERRAEDLTG